MEKLTICQIKSVSIKISIKDNNHIILVNMAGNKEAPQNECNANIYCIDNHNNILWQVDNADGMFDRDSFVYLEMTSDRKLVARRFFGKKYLINIESGFAEEIGWEK